MGIGVMVVMMVMCVIVMVDMSIVVIVVVAMIVVMIATIVVAQMIADKKDATDVMAAAQTTLQHHQTPAAIARANSHTSSSLRSAAG